MDQQGDATTVHAVSLWSSSRRVLRLDDTPMTGVERSSDGDLHETPPRPAARLPSLAGANGAASSIRRFADVWTGGGELMPAFSTSSAAAAGAAHSWCARLLRGSASATLSGKTSFGACAIVLGRVSGEKVHWMRVHVWAGAVRRAASHMMFATNRLWWERACARTLDVVGRSFGVERERRQMDCRRAT